MLRAIKLVAALAIVLLAGPAAAHKVHLKSIDISHPWVRAMPGGATLTAGYAKITNKGKEPDRLIAASLKDAARAELHETLTEDGINRMRPLVGGIEIPAGATVTLATGGLHIMFLDIAKPLDEETYVPGSLTFEKAGKLDLEFYVEPLTGRAGEATSSSSGEHHH